MNSDSEILLFIHERLEHVYGESPNTDYMIRLKQIADKLNESTGRRANMSTQEDYRDWITRLHAIVEEFHIRDRKNTWFFRMASRFGYFKKRPQDQCAL